MSVSLHRLPFVRFRRSVALVIAVPVSLAAAWAITTVQGSFAIGATIAAAGFIVSFMADGKLLQADLAQRSRVRQLLALQAVSAIIASAIIIYAWSGAATLVCLSGCSDAKIAEVGNEAMGSAAILGVAAGLLFLAPSLSVWRQGRR